MTLYYRDSSNNYIGGFDGATGKVPVGAIEVSFPPTDARSKWNGTGWDDPIITKEEEKKVELVKQGYTLEERISAIELYIAKNDRTQVDAIQAIKDLIDAEA